MKLKKFIIYNNKQNNIKLIYYSLLSFIKNKEKITKLFSKLLKLQIY